MKKRRTWLRRILIGLTLLLLVGLGPYLYSRWAAATRVCQIFESDAGPTTRALDGEEISIVIFNIAHGRGAVESNLNEGGAEKKKRISQIAKFLKEVDADIVILNEADFCSTWSGHQNQAEAIATEADYRYRGEQRNLDFRFIYGSWKFGNAILSRYPIKQGAIIDYPDERSWEPLVVGKKRGAQFQIELPGGNNVGIIPVHLEHRSESVRIASVDMIIESVRAGDLPTILAGDFNSTPTGMPGSRKAAERGNTIDKLDESELFIRPTMANEKENFTFPSTDPTTTIDWIMVPAEFDLIEYRVLQTDLSDHLPVFARVKLSNE